MEKILKSKSEPFTSYDGIEKDSDPHSFGPHHLVNAPKGADMESIGDLEHGPGIELAKKLGK